MVILARQVYGGEDLHCSSYFNCFCKWTEDRKETRSKQSLPLLSSLWKQKKKMNLIFIGSLIAKEVPESSRYWGLIHWQGVGSNYARIKLGLISGWKLDYSLSPGEKKEEPYIVCMKLEEDWKSIFFKTSYLLDNKDVIWTTRQWNCWVQTFLFLERNILLSVTLASIQI